jgi:release factor glutamine methyltransferase
MIPLCEALAQISTRLKAAGIDESRREARLLLAQALGCHVDDLLLRDVVPEHAALDLAIRRAAHEPFALIVGRAAFWTLDLEVSPLTLIPRADSETLIEAVLARFTQRDSVSRILDLGTGTGALLLAVLAEFPQAIGVGVDRIEQVVMLARRNAVRNHLAARSHFVVGDWAASLGTAGFDIIVTNPPYIESAAIAELMPEVRCFEPASALDGGADGLDAYRAILPVLGRVLAPGGAAFMEIGCRQADQVTHLARAAGFEVELRHDIATLPRALIITPTKS